MKRLILFAITLAVFPYAANAQKDVLFDAMKDELARSMKELKLENDPGPYYISYHISDEYNLQIQADSGAVVANSESRNRLFNTDIRVGDYEHDNSNFTSLNVLSNLGELIADALSSIIFPVDDDYDAVRRRIWQGTDSAYKSAVEILNRKNTALQRAAQTDRPPDFTRGKATVSIAKANDFTVSREQWEERVNRIASLLQRNGNIHKSDVNLEIRIANAYYVNSEGAQTLEPSSRAQLTIKAATTAKDGMPLENYRVYTAARPEELPGMEIVEADIQALAAGLEAARTAIVGEEYNGPVLFEGEAAGELFARGFVNFLKGTRDADSDSPQIAALLNTAANPFVSRLDTRVAANSLSIKAVPSLKNYGGKNLAGAYATDNEGVPAQDVSLVENGILKNLLMTRAPVKGIEASNGHNRGNGAAPGVIQVISENKKPYDQLKQNLIEAAREEGLAYGYIVRGLVPAAEIDGAQALQMIQDLLGGNRLDPSQFRLANPYSIFRLYPDGREERVRGLEFGIVSVNALRNILAVSEQETVYNYFLSATDGAMAATVITPSLLINGISLKKSAGVHPKPPVVDFPIQ